MRALILLVIMFSTFAPLARAEPLSQRIDALLPTLTLVKPEGPGPFPTVLLLHGCGGRRAFMDEYARVVREAGAAAVIVDSFAHRRIGRVEAMATVCSGARLQGRERAGDLFAAMAWARAQDWVDRERLIAAGWSHGSWTIMDGLSLRPGEEMARITGLDDLPDEPLAGLASVFLVYPYAGMASYAGKRPWRLQPRGIAIVAGRDYAVGTEAPMAALARVKDQGVRLDVHLFETSSHAYDEPDTRDPRMRYDPAAAARTQDLLRDLIALTR